MNHAWTTSISVLAATGMEIQRFGLDQIGRILVITYCILGSLAALKYLLQGGRYSARRRIFPPERAREGRDDARTSIRHLRRKSREPLSARRTPQEPVNPYQAPEEPFDPYQASRDPVTTPLSDFPIDIGQEPSATPARPEPLPPAAPPKPDPVSDLPSYPSRSDIKGIYEVENPGFTRNANYGLRLKRAPDGVLLSCELDQELVCVFLRKGLTEVGVNLRRHGLQEVFDLLDAMGQPLAEYPAGRLRLVNAVPAICKDLGSSLQLVEKGQIKIFVKE